MSENAFLLDIVSSPSEVSDGLALMTMCRDEMFYLPAFLDYYRDMGVKRFYVVDDRSVDGSLEFLSRQPDVIVLHSRAPFEQPILVQGGGQAGKNVNASILWRTEMLNRFGCDSWCLLVDVDEFIRLPEGTGIKEVASRAESEAMRSVMGVMLDVYPRDISGLEVSTFEPGGNWFFDGAQHLKLRPGRKPKVVYGGSRARLMHQMGVAYASTRDRLKWLLKGRRFPAFNAMHKPVLLRWREGEFFTSSHDCTLAYSQTLLLPMAHYKFTHDTMRRVEQAVSEQNHFKGSFQYQLLSDLLLRMRDRQSSFLYKKSVPIEDFSALLRTGNARL